MLAECFVDSIIGTESALPLSKDNGPKDERFSLKQTVAKFSVLTALVYGGLNVLPPALPVAFGADGVAEEIVPDENTVLLDHFNTETLGTVFGPLEYTPSLPGFGEAGVFGPGIYVRYDFPAWYSGSGADLNTQGTVEIWVNPEQLGDLLNINWNATSSYPSAGHVFHLRIDPTSDDILSYGTWNFERCCLPSSIQGTSKIPIGKWTHVAVSWSPTISKLYVNGVVEASIDANVYPSIAPTVHAYLNYWGGAGGSTGAGVFSGFIDELHISKVQRTDEEIRAHARLPRLSAPWKCYKARGKAPRVEVTLEDRWETKDTRMLQPVSVCHQVAVDGQDVSDPAASLTCYKVRDVKGQPKFTPRHVYVANAVDEQDVGVSRADTLCLPSTIVEGTK